MFCAHRQVANFSLYSSHTQGQQLPPPQHSSDFGFSGFCGSWFVIFSVVVCI
ncbi:hypothetical protein P20429_1469 [Pseudoalteromonas sp. BSi20429]|jgi:hypothetical protein|nr:hypothetical protein P20429_1469 [Pseudoalteromonas sp. BSi20429]